ncbi:Uncharacterised protein [Porphyromonas endodontalis]|nr:Uncharacterised protein [Porphyromonas endodontalis]
MRFLTLVLRLHFNSTKVQFGAPTLYDIEHKLNNFNSTKVQFGDRQIESIDLQNFISIPLRYNLESPFASAFTIYLRLFQFH